MYSAVENMINQIDTWVWGWWMILLLLGTHIFMTIRTGVIQRKIGTAIRLSVAKDPDGIYDRNRKHHRCGNRDRTGRSGCSPVVLAYRRFWDRNEVQ